MKCLKCDNEMYESLKYNSMANNNESPYQHFWFCKCGHEEKVKPPSDEEQWEMGAEGPERYL